MSSTAHRIANHTHALLACRALRDGPLHSLLQERGPARDIEQIDWVRCAQPGHRWLPAPALEARLMAGLYEALRLGLVQRRR
jgi:hypothetical protein